MRNPILTLIVAAASLCAVGNANSVDIVVLDVQHSIDIAINLRGDAPSSQTTTSLDPLSGRLETGQYGSTAHYALASAQADTFSVAAATVAFGGSSNAAASTMLTFSVLSNSLTPLTLDFTAGGSAAIFSSGLVGLFDTTIGQSVFSYGWARLGPSNVPWQGGQPFGAVSLSLQPLLLASHDYALTMKVATDASSDSQHVSISVSGLDVLSPVPEPETYALMLVGLGVIGFVARRRAAQRALTT
jgi:hypothetical protein